MRWMLFDDINRLARFAAQPHHPVYENVALVKRRIQRGHRQLLVFVDGHLTRPPREAPAVSFC